MALWLNSTRRPGRCVSVIFLLWTNRTLVTSTCNYSSGGGYVAELETRYSLFSQPGKLRVIGWVNEYFAGSYRDAINLSLATGIDPTTAIVQSRQSQINMDTSSISSKRSQTTSACSDAGAGITARGKSPPSPISIP